MTSSLISLIKEIVDNIKDSEIRKLTIDIISNPKLSFTSIKPLIELTESPAAPRKHHMFSGGLMIHTVSVAKIALALCKIFEEIYGVEINRDLVIAASILHDIYKYYQYDRDALNGGYRPRDDWYLSHDYAVVAEVAKRGGGDNIIRVLSEVHGIAPITTFEGLVVHLADSIDAKFGEHIQNEIISEIKNSGVENRGCKPIELFDIAIKKFGIHTVFRYAKDNAKLYELFNELCSEVASKGK
uniref:HD domain-containing protein n=1 Tax=Ignisphaera aggregans TaxID=334771 RepID=A0A7C5TKB5_9CREN